MSAFIANRFSMAVKTLGNKTSVADHAVARLMFYLHCVGCVITIDENENIEHLSDYHNYLSMTSSDIDKLLTLCLAYSPRAMEGQCFFENQELCGGLTNNFLEITAVSNVLAVTREIVANSRRCIVKEVMVHTDGYYDINYNTPMTMFRPWIEAMRYNRSRPLRKCKVTIPPNYPFSDIEKFSNNISANILIAYFFPVWIVVWICMSCCDDE